MLLDCFLKFTDIPLSECLHHVVEPLEVSAFQRVDYVFFKKLGDVKNVLTKQDGHAHLDR